MKDLVPLPVWQASLVQMASDSLSMISYEYIALLQTDNILQCDAHLIQPLIEEDHCHTECKAQIASDNRNVVEIKQCTILCKINSSASVIHSLRTSCVKNALKWNWVLFFVLSCRTEPGEGLHFFAFLCSRVGLIAPSSSSKLQPVVCMSPLVCHSRKHLSVK